MRVVVCDTGPIMHLQEAAALHLLARAGEVLIPPAVDEELRRHNVAWVDARPTWIRIGQLGPDDRRYAEQWRRAGGLGLGEAEAIALARSARAEWLLTDDAGARMVAVLLGLEVHGSLAVVIWAAATSHVSRAEAFSALDRLAKSSLWISARVIGEARQALDGLFK